MLLPTETERAGGRKGRSRKEDKSLLQGRKEKRKGLSELSRREGKGPQRTRYGGQTWGPSDLFRRPFVARVSDRQGQVWWGNQLWKSVVGVSNAWRSGIPRETSFCGVYLHETERLFWP